MTEFTVAIERSADQAPDGFSSSNSSRNLCQAAGSILNGSSASSHRSPFDKLGQHHPHAMRSCGHAAVKVFCDGLQSASEGATSFRRLL